MSKPNCDDNGHIFGSRAVCVFCGASKPASELSMADLAELIERVARAMCEARGQAPDEMVPWPAGSDGTIGSIPAWECFRIDAQAALAKPEPADG